jgi:hypothetical protein
MGAGLNICVLTGKAHHRLMSQVDVLRNVCALAVYLGC